MSGPRGKQLIGPKPKLRFANWKKYQHYKDRDPQWIKLHRRITQSDEWLMLADASRLLALVCMMQASGTEDGSFTANPIITQRFGSLEQEPDYQPLIDCGWLEWVEVPGITTDNLASTMLADASTTLALRREYTKENILKKENPPVVPPRGEAGAGDNSTLIAAPLIDQEQATRIADQWNALLNDESIDWTRGVKPRKLDPSPTWYPKLAKLRRSGVTPEDWEGVVLARFYSPHHRGENERRWSMSMGWILGKPAVKVTEIAEKGHEAKGAEGRPQSYTPPQTKAQAEAAASARVGASQPPPKPEESDTLKCPKCMSTTTYLIPHSSLPKFQEEGVCVHCWNEAEAERKKEAEKKAAPKVVEAHEVDPPEDAENEAEIDAAVASIKSRAKGVSDRCLI